jgi:hypothetical protein
MSVRKSSIVATIALAGTAVLSLPETPLQAQEPVSRSVYLVRQDASDCSNSNVPNVDSGNVGGELSIHRGNDGNTTVKVAMTVSPKTTYHFYLKCVRQLGDITTDDEGIGMAQFSFPTSSVGPIYAFDMYPEGAPAGNKFQSVRVAF